MAVVALATMVVAIVIGTKKQINIGIMGIVGACILSLVANISVRELVAGFNITLFLRLLGIQLLVCAAQSNGTMETLAKKLITLGSKASLKLIPVIIYITFLILGLAGVDVIFLATPFVISLALQMGIEPLKLLFSLILAFQGSAISPLAASGINTFSVAEQAGISVNGWNCAINTSIATTIMFVVIYFVFGWHKEKERKIQGLEGSKFDSKQLLTLGGFVAYVIMTMFLKQDTLVAPTLVAFVLMLVGAAQPKKVIASIPWNVLIMIGGMSLLTNIVALLGGVELLTNIIAQIKIPALCTPIMLLVAGTMSFFSSGNGVVIPTLIPVASGLSANTSALVTAVGMGSGCTGVSPFSTIGGHMMSCYDSIYKPEEKERDKTFNKLLIFALICLGVNAIFCLLGLYNLTLFGR